MNYDVSLTFKEDIYEKTIILLLSFSLVTSPCSCARKQVNESNADIAISKKYNNYIHEIVYNQSPEVLLHSDYKTYIDAKKEYFDALVAEENKAVQYFTSHLRGIDTFGLEETIMAAVCAEITGVCKDGGWSDASVWIGIYDDYLKWGVMPAFWDYDLFLPFPKPECDSFYIDDNGDVVCEGLFESSYFNDISDYGYNIYYGFRFNEQLLIQNNCIIVLSYREDCEGLRISFKNIKGLAKDNEFSLIKSYIEQKQESQTVAFVLEHSEGEAYAKTGIRVFLAFSKTNLLGSYFIHNNTVAECSLTFEENMPFNRTAYANMIFPCDIDSDGKYEIFAAGINYVPTRSYIADPELSISIYKLNENNELVALYTFSSVYYENYVTLKKISDTEIRLIGSSYTEEGISETDYGRFIIQNNELKLVK